MCNSVLPLFQAEIKPEKPHQTHIFILPHASLTAGIYKQHNKGF